MSYFRKFPLIDYDINGDGTTRKTVNLLKRLGVVSPVDENVVLYDYYDVKDGERPEIVAGKFYGDPGLHWVIMLINKIRNPYYDWPMGHNELVRYVEKKYGVLNKNAVHHYENTKQQEVLSTAPSATAVSNFTYEDRRNEDKRLVKILKKTYLSQFVDEFKEKIIQ